MWAVGIDRPYYPSIDFYEDELVAYREYVKLCVEESDENGAFDSKVFISEIKESTYIKTSY